MNKNILVYIEITDNKIENVTGEIISYLHQNFNDCNINGLLLTDNSTYNSVKNDLKKLNIDKLYVIKNDNFNRFETCIFASQIADFIENNQVDIFLAGATQNGRDLAPRVASKLNIGLTADCTELNIDENAKLLATRPTYGGKMMAAIYSKTRPDFAIVRPGAFKIERMQTKETEIVEINSNLCNLNQSVNIITTMNKALNDRFDSADIIIAGGLGLQTKDNFDLIYKFSQLIDAAPAASRGAVERGWAPKSIQIGQTGKSVSPKIYIAFGISGAMQHLVGISNSNKIIAVNTDINAPIMQSADMAVIADAAGVLNSLLDKYS